MSIPKEPRQLMINLMYLVLTALLALNVSAEVMNAFFDLDKSLKNSNSLTKTGVDATKQGIQPILDKKPLLKAPLNAGIDEINEEVNAFVDYIDEIQDKLIDASGDKSGAHDDGDYIDNDPNNKPRGKKNKDVPTKLMVEGYGADGGVYANQGPFGPDIAEKVAALKTKMIEIYSNTVQNKDVMKEGKLTKKEVEERIAGFSNSIPLAIESEEEIQKKTKDGSSKSWSEYKFKQMPLAACLPALTKLQTDARNTQATAVNKFAELVGGREIKLNKFFPVMNAKKGYVIKGEKFEAEVAIGAFSSEFAKSSSIKVNGTSVRLNAEGKGTFTETANSTGKKKLKLTASVKNPITGDVMSGNSEFEYEVGVRSATVTADKMNVFYIGVDNPVSVTVAGSSSNTLKVSGTGCNINGSKGKYNVTASRPGEATISVSAEGFPNTPFKYRVKRIPDPVPALGAGPNKNGGAMGNGEFKAQLGIAAILEGFDFDAKCNIMGYELTRVAKRQDPVSQVNRGARYGSDCQRLVRMAAPGDTYYFDKLKAKCPGDAAGRKLPSIVFRIK